MEQTEAREIVMALTREGMAAYDAAAGMDRQKLLELARVHYAAMEDYCARRMVYVNAYIAARLPADIGRAAE